MPEDLVLSNVPNSFNEPYRSGGRHRRLRAVILDIPFTLDFYITGNVTHMICTDGLPPGAKYIGSELDRMALSIYAVFEHESFAPVPHGHYIPVQHVKYEPVKE